MPIPTADVDAIVAVGAPVLCVDTCIILDIMRDPTRETAKAHERQAALDLLSMMETGNALTGLVAEQVQIEFANNAMTVQEEAVRALRKLREQVARIEAVAAVFGGVGKADLGHLDDYVARSQAVNRWMAAATRVDGSAEIAARALNRVNQVRTPAQRGKDSIKDCAVIETYLDMISKLRAGGLASKVAFVSSNTKDYAGETGHSLNADLSGEFEAIGMEYAPNLAAAKFMLGL